MDTYGNIIYTEENIKMSRDEAIEYLYIQILPGLDYYRQIQTHSH